MPKEKKLRTELWLKGWKDFKLSSIDIQSGRNICPSLTLWNLWNLSNTIISFNRRWKIWSKRWWRRRRDSPSFPFQGGQPPFLRDQFLFRWALFALRRGSSKRNTWGNLRRKTKKRGKIKTKKESLYPLSNRCPFLLLKKGKTMMTMELIVRLGLTKWEAGIQAMIKV